MHVGYLLTRRLEVTVVGHDIVRDGDLPCERQLRSDSGIRLTDAKTIASDQAEPLQGLVGAHDDERGKRLVGAGFDEQSRFVQEVWGLALLESRYVRGTSRTDHRMHDRIELFACLFVTEDQVADLLSIQASPLIEHSLAELVDDPLQTRRPWLDDFSRQRVRVDDRDAELAEHSRDGRLAARYSSRQTHHRLHAAAVLNIASCEQDDSACANAKRMRAVIQRVNEATVRVDGEPVGAIERGLLVFLGAADGDEERDVQYAVDKIAGLRVFPNDEGRMSLSVGDIEGSVLVVSQFTLFGDVRRGRRPSFDGAASPEDAERLYEEVVERLRGTGIPVETGTFRAMMRVEAVVDGPVTIQIDSRKLY